MPRSTRHPIIYKLLDFLAYHGPVLMPSTAIELERVLSGADRTSPDFGIWDRVFTFVFGEQPKENRDPFGDLVVGENGLRVERDPRWDELFSQDQLSGYRNLKIALRVHRFYRIRQHRENQKQAA